MISAITIDRINDDGEPQLGHGVDINFYNAADGIIATIYVFSDGKVAAYAFDGTTITHKLKIEASELSAETQGETK